MSYPSIEHIKSKEDLSQFIDELRKTLKDHPEVWENSDLNSFLEAMAAWLRDCDGYFKNVGREIPKSPATWRFVAELLAASKIYE